MSDEDIYDSDDDLELDSGDGYIAASIDDMPQEEGGVSTLRESLRQQLQSDMEAFLAAGGRIHEIPANVVSDPPKKPNSNYGGQPI